MILKKPFKVHFFPECSQINTERDKTYNTPRSCPQQLALAKAFRQKLRRRNVKLLATNVLRVWNNDNSGPKSFSEAAITFPHVQGNRGWREARRVAAAVGTVSIFQLSTLERDACWATWYSSLSGRIHWVGSGHQHHRKKHACRLVWNIVPPECEALCLWLHMWLGGGGIYEISLFLFLYSTVILFPMPMIASKWR